MSKYLLIALAALGLALAVPMTSSAAPISNGAALKSVVDSVDPTTEVAWHCRRWSGWCRGGGYYRRYRPWRRHYYRRYWW
jgi:hypothetical protein